MSAKKFTKTIVVLYAKKKSMNIKSCIKIDDGFFFSFYISLVDYFSLFNICLIKYFIQVNFRFIITQRLNKINLMSSENYIAETLELPAEIPLFKYKVDFGGLKKLL